MKIITAYPIVKDGKVIANKLAANTLNYSSANGEKTKEFLQKAKEAGLGDAALKTISALRNKNKVAPAPVPVVVAPQEPQGMSTTTKVLIAGGGVLLLGVLIYAATKK